MTSAITADPGFRTMYAPTVPARSQKPNRGSRASGPPTPAASPATGIHHRYRIPNTTDRAATTTNSRIFQLRRIGSPSLSDESNARRNRGEPSGVHVQGRAVHRLPASLRSSSARPARVAHSVRLIEIRFEELVGLIP